jgi:hypothetical protein
MLKMKSSCEKCNIATSITSLAYICSYECTFCKECTDAMNAICSNCDGELLKRPTREKKFLQVATSQLKKKIFGGK